MDPFDDPQVAGPIELLIFKAAGVVSTNVCVSEQPLASCTRHVYVPAQRLLTVGEFGPAGSHV